MILTNAVKDFETNVNLESKQFTIGDTNKVIDLLISQYKYPIRTLVQEYICNAIDASKEKDLNFDISTIKVELPNHFNKMMFSVRDFGIGLSHDRIHQVFCVMGASTKSKDNNQIGGFGLGAKSALAYTDHFFIASFLEGIRTDYLVRKAPHGGIVLDTLGSEPTTEKNGTLIQVKAKDNNDISKFNDAYSRLTEFWDVKPKCAHNKDVKKTKISDILTLSDHEVTGKEYSEGTWVDLGGVLYSVKQRLDQSRARTTIVKIPVGAVMPLQTRESLNLEDKTTKDIIQEFMLQASADIKTYKKQFEGKTFAESFDSLNKISNLISGVVSLKEFTARLDYNGLNFEIDNLVHSRKKQNRTYGSSPKLANIKTSSSAFLYSKDINSIVNMDVNPKKSRLHYHLNFSDKVIEVTNPEMLKVLESYKQVKKLSEVPFEQATKKRAETVNKVMAKLGNHGVEHWMKLDDLSVKGCYATNHVDSMDYSAAIHLGYTVYVVKQCYVKRLQSANLPSVGEVIKTLNVSSEQLAMSKACRMFPEIGSIVKKLQPVLKNKNMLKVVKLILNVKEFHGLLFDTVSDKEYKRALKIAYKLNSIKLRNVYKSSDVLKMYLKTMRGV
jgi:hypothetical protein